MINHKDHWKNIYQKNNFKNFSWYQEKPNSIKLINSLKLNKDAKIFDVGAGTSYLANKLIEDGYKNITINDISSESIEISRLHSLNKFNWLEGDITTIDLPKSHFNVWHDRAVLHFFTDKNQQYNYFDLLKRKVKSRGYVIFSEFAVGGAKKCCGLDVVNYNEEMFEEGLGDDFKLLESFNFEYEHPTNGNKRKYIYTLFRRN